MLKVNILFAVRRFHLKLFRTKSLVSYVEIVERQTQFGLTLNLLNWLFYRQMSVLICKLIVRSGIWISDHYFRYIFIIFQCRSHQLPFKYYNYSKVK